MKKYKRICIIGNSGAGKSTLAVKLGKLFKLPVVHLDKIYWQPNWVGTPKEITQIKVVEATTEDEWIIDGNNKSTFAPRFERADMVIFLDFKPIFCLWRVIMRALFTTYRPDMAEGCKERFNLDFYKYIWNFKNKMNQYIWNAVKNYQGKFEFYHLCSQNEVDDFLKNFEGQKSVDK